MNINLSPRELQIVVRSLVYTNLNTRSDDLDDDTLRNNLETRLIQEEEAQDGRTGRHNPDGPKAAPAGHIWSCAPCGHRYWMPVPIGTNCPTCGEKA